MPHDRAGGPHTHHLRVQRTARYYTLGGGGCAPRDIWFVLHGYGQLAGDVIRYFSDLASEESLVVAPEALNRFYLAAPTPALARSSERPVGASWMTREDRASEIADYVEYLDALYGEVAAGPAGDGARLNVIGFSQGAATATRWVTLGRPGPRRLVLWGGLLPPDVDLSGGASALRGARLILVAGTRDKYVTEEMLNAEQARLDSAAVPYDLVRFDGGHAVNRTVFPRLTGLPDGPSGQLSVVSDR